MYDTVVHDFYYREREGAVSHSWKLWTMSVLSFVTFAMLVPTVCYAGLGEPLPVEEGHSRAELLCQKTGNAGELKQTTEDLPFVLIGGFAGDPSAFWVPVMIAFGVMALGAIIVFIVAVARATSSSSRSKGAWQKDHELKENATEKSPVGNSGQ